MLYAGWYKSQLTNAGGTYNSTYKFVSDNWPSGIAHFYWTVYDSNWNTIINYSSLTDNYIFSLNDLLTETQYNNLNYLTINATNAEYHDIQLPSDIKLALLS